MNPTDVRPDDTGSDDTGSDDTGSEDAGSDAAGDPAAATDAPGAPASPRRSGEQLDRLAELEEERRFLLKSLRDLEREHDAGDVDDEDYRTLKDGYTVRAATVLRQIDEGKASLAPKRPRRWGLVAAVTVCTVALAVGVGVVLAQAWGERGVGESITGRTPGDEVRSILTDARIALDQGDWITANDLYRQAIEAERDRGVDNAEALTYYGWTIALLTFSGPEEERQTEQLELALLAFDGAIEIDATYPDPYCFAAIVNYRFLGDAESALPYVETCAASDPPADVATLVETLAEQIRAETG